LIRNGFLLSTWGALNGDPADGLAIRAMELPPLQVAR
jgi:hypothetical protein